MESEIQLKDMLNRILLVMTLFLTVPFCQAQNDSLTLNWPDTSNWITIEADDISFGIKIKLPPSMKYYAHSEGITLFINDDVS